MIKDYPLNEFKADMNEPTNNKISEPIPDGLLFSEAHSPYNPTLSEVFGASFRQFAPYESAKRLIYDPTHEEEEGYNYATDPQLDNYEGSSWRFLNSGSRAETALRLKNLNIDLEDQMILSSTDSWVPQVIASLATPTILAPLAPLRVLRTASLAKRFTGGALFTSTLIAPEEFLMASQIETRTAGQSAVVLTGAALIGGTLSGFLGRSSRKGFHDYGDGPKWTDGVNVSGLKEELIKQRNSLKRTEENKATWDKNSVGNNQKIEQINKQIDEIDADIKANPAPKKNPIKTVIDKATNTWKPVGANLSPEKQRQSMWQSMDGDALKETGVGIEKLPWNPTIRLTNSPNPIVRSVASQMVDFGGMIQKKVAKGEAMTQSLEANYRTTFTPSLVNVMRSMDEQYLGYRNIVAKDGDIARSIQMLKQKGMDYIKKPTGLTEFQFRDRVSNALRNNGDEVTDSATDFVNKAATKARKHLEHIKKQAEDVRLFERDAQKIIAGLEARIAKATADELGDLQDLLIKAKDRLAQIRQNGVNVNTSAGYFPRMWRVDKIMDNLADFTSVVKNWSKNKYNLTDSEATKFANEMIDQVTRSKPYYNLDEGVDSIDWITQASSTKARTFEIPDRLVVEFLENDVEAVLRHHTKSMGMDIELTRTFGDISMSGTIKNITDEYEILIKQAPTTVERQALAKNLKDDLRDVRGLRDRLRGTYGASKDPHALSSRSIRTFKSFNILVGMGSAMVSSVPDVARSVMVEGFKTVNNKGLKHFFKNSQSAIKRMSKKELNQAGISADAYLGLRSAQFTDMGDMFGSRASWERNMNQSVDTFFMLNGLNYWNQFMKEFTGNVTMLRMTGNLMTDWGKLSKREHEKLLSNGIDQQMHSRMKLQMKSHAKKEDGEWLPETDLWTDSTARLRFRNALNQTVDRTIITPGAGDRALWTSTETGSLMTQFKGYGQGSMVRLLTAGLQEKDAAFWQGAFMLVGLAAIVNEIKNVQYGIDDSRDTYNDKLINAVDRSGILGWFTDVNNSLEKISDYKFGMRSLFGSTTEMPIPSGAKFGAIFGPTASNLATMGAVGSDLIRMEADQKTADSARFITPGGNLFWADPIMDGIFNSDVN